MGLQVLLNLAPACCCSDHTLCSSPLGFLKSTLCCSVTLCCAVVCNEVLSSSAAATFQVPINQSDSESHHNIYFHRQRVLWNKADSRCPSGMRAGHSFIHLECFFWTLGWLVTSHSSALTKWRCSGELSDCNWAPDMKLSSISPPENLAPRSPILFSSEHSQLPEVIILFIY